MRTTPLFFGRGDFSAKVCDAVKSSRFVAIVGASGSGKSSIAHAGLLPKLRDPASGEVWAIHTMVPGTDPAGRLAELLAHALHPEPEFKAADLDEEVMKLRRRLVVEVEDEKGALGRLVRQVCVKRPGITRVLLLVDQFEEAFTLATPDKAQATARFLEELVLAVRNQDAPLTIVVTLRSDQFPEVTDRRDLAALFEKSQILVGPMTPDELREAIVKPLEKVGGRFQHGLVDRIVADVGAEANALPLLEYALDALWTHRDSVSGELTHVAYNAMGCLKGAIATRANEIFGTLPAPQQEAARDVLLRLVRPGAGTLDSKRPARVGAEGEAVRAAIDALVKARLVIADKHEIEIVHEALIREWDLLRGWVKDARDVLELRDRLEGDAKRWAALAEDDSDADTLLLPPGLRLEEGRKLIGQEAGLLDGFPVIRRYVERSIAYGAKRDAAEAARQAAEQAHTQTKRQNRRLQIAIVAAALALLGAAAAGVGIWRAKKSLGVALTDASAQRDVAQREKRLAESQKMLAQRNFAAATSAVDGLIFDVTQGLQGVEGMRVDTMRRILETVRKTVDGLLATAPDDAELLRLKAVMLETFADTYVVAGDVQGALQAAGEGLDITKTLATRDPGNAKTLRDLSVSLNKLGDVRLQAGDQAGALAAYSQGHDSVRRFASRDPGDVQVQRDVLISLDKVGDVKRQAGDLAGALAAYSQGLGIARKLATQDPDNTLSQRSLSVSLEKIGDVRLQLGDATEALALYRQGIEISRRLAARDPGNVQAQRDLSVSLFRIGSVSQAAGNKDKALAAYNQAFDIAKTLAAQDPSNVRYQRYLAVSLERVGDVKLKAGDRAGALDDYTQSLAIRTTAAAQDQGNAQVQRELLISLQRIGDIKLETGDRGAALGAFKKSLEIARKLAARNEDNDEAQRDVSITLERIGTIELKAGDRVAALDDYERSLAIAKRIAAQDARNEQNQRDVSLGLERIGDVKLEAGDQAGALDAYKQSLDLRKKIADQDSGNVEAQRDLFVSLTKMGAAKLKAGERDAALAYFKQALSIAETLAKQNAGDAQAASDLAGVRGQIERLTSNHYILPLPQ